MHLTVKQMQGLLKHPDSPYIRGIGFLYLRFTCPSKQLWQWFEPYLDDPEEFVPGGDKSIKMTMGKYVQNLLEDKHYYSTILPSIAVPVKREIDKMLLEREMKKQKNLKNEKIRSKLKVGTRVTAEYYEDKKFYEATISKVLDNGKFEVLFTEYGNKEEVEIGAIKFTGSSSRSRSRSQSPSSSSSSRTRTRARSSRSRSRTRSSRSRSRTRNSRSRSRSRDRRRRSRSRSTGRHRHSRRSRSPSHSRSSRSRRSRSRSPEDLEEIIRKRAQESAVAHGKDYAKRPPSYKTSLSLQACVGTNRKRSKTPPPPPRTRSPVRREASPPKKRQPSVQHRAKMEQLKAIYGDSSGSKKPVSDYADS
eukprot:TRINITY_DN4828_c0_g1_i8.p1 TRINITY_DN4828_c0_g1~~TRINITY_DN4828_c0_g1_i8.p1  ORF type:complete len:362 (+),score=34.95 TRINITY_DN4828_c0_g1_i8:736-1821(+)